MIKKLTTVIINNQETGPLGEAVIDFLKSQTSELPYLDFKWFLDLSSKGDFAEIAKDIFAFSNYGGGWILIGWKEENHRANMVGIPDEYKIDQATIQQKFNAYVSEEIELLYKEEIKKDEQGNGIRLGFLFIPASDKELTPSKKGSYKKKDKERIVFEKDDLFFRRGTQSIVPNKKEKEIIKNRLEKEDYIISVLSGEPDKIEEDIFSNLFEIKKFPKKIYIGIKKDYDHATIKNILNQLGVNPAHYYKFKEWSGEIVTFENLKEDANPYSNLIEKNSAREEKTEDWVNDEDKQRILIELLRRELIHNALSKGMFCSYKKNRIFYQCLEDEKREESWAGRYAKSKRVVASKFYAAQFKKFMFWHHAFTPSFENIGGKYFLKVNPTFVITEEGLIPKFGYKEGRIITRLSFRKHNNLYYNNILFWIHQLGEGKEIKIEDYLEISSKPLTLKMPVGILYDTPSSALKIKEDEEDENDIQSDIS